MSGRNLCTEGKARLLNNRLGLGLGLGGANPPHTREKPRIRYDEQVEGLVALVTRRRRGLVLLMSCRPAFPSAPGILDPRIGTVCFELSRVALGRSDVADDLDTDPDALVESGPWPRPLFAWCAHLLMRGGYVRVPSPPCPPPGVTTTGGASRGARNTSA